MVSHRAADTSPCGVQALRVFPPSIRPAPAPAPAGSAERRTCRYRADRGLRSGSVLRGPAKKGSSRVMGSAARPRYIDGHYDPSHVMPFLHVIVLFCLMHCSEDRFSNGPPASAKCGLRHAGHARCCLDLVSCIPLCGHAAGARKDRHPVLLRWPMHFLMVHSQTLDGLYERAEARHGTVNLLQPCQPPVPLPCGLVSIGWFLNVETDQTVFTSAEPPRFQLGARDVNPCQPYRR
ncbi:hypothetical protein IWX90DRAFT_62158 [Phyllosticta citrichinensis]|uniref:Uncharacterized protein n=1 Tax=Phyllosticta citrichinensis TaxID=1130410 RepID=A0ABR1XH65_9PEZI